MSYRVFKAIYRPELGDKTLEIHYDDPIRGNTVAITNPEDNPALYRQAIIYADNRWFARVSTMNFVQYIEGPNFRWNRFRISLLGDGIIQRPLIDISTQVKSTPDLIKYMKATVDDGQQWELYLTAEKIELVSPYDFEAMKRVIDDCCPPPQGFP